MSIWKNAFKINQGRDLSPEDKEFVIKVVRKIKERKLSSVALFVLESTRPLHNIGANFLYFLSPSLGFIFSSHDITRIAEILENPGGVKFIISKLEEDEDEGK